MFVYFRVCLLLMGSGLWALLVDPRFFFIFRSLPYPFKQKKVNFFFTSCSLGFHSSV